MKTKYIFLAAAIVAFSEMAYAIPTLRLYSGSPVLVTDNGAGDFNSASGQVTWIGSLGHWNLNVDTGTTYPVLGTLASPKLDISFDATTISGGTLWIYFTDNGFGPTFGANSFASIGATTNGTVSYWVYGGASNNLFDFSQLLYAGPFSGPSFSANDIGAAINNEGPYSITGLIKIVQSGAGHTSGDIMFGVGVPDGGTTLLLLGMGLTGLGLISRLRRCFR